MMKCRRSRQMLGLVKEARLRSRNLATDWEQKTGVEGSPLIVAIPLGIRENNQKVAPVPNRWTNQQRDVRSGVPRVLEGKK